MGFDHATNNIQPPFHVEDRKGPVIHEGPDWLSRSVVGVVHNLDLIPYLQNAAMIEGFNYIQVRYLGNDLVLLIGPDHRVTWDRCTGLPIHMWNNACFAEAVKPIGDFISSDARTTNFSILEYARILV